MAYSYLAKVAIGFDQLCNAILLGSPDETFSARCWRCREEGYWDVARALVDMLFFWQKAHCRTAWFSEVIRAQMPSSYRCECYTTQDKEIGYA